MNVVAFVMVTGGMMLVLLAPFIGQGGAIRRSFIGVSMALRGIYRPPMRDKSFDAMLVQIDDAARSPRVHVHD